MYCTPVALCQAQSRNKDTGIQNKYLLTFLEKSHIPNPVAEIWVQSPISCKVAYFKQCVSFKQNYIQNKFINLSFS